MPRPVRPAVAFTIIGIGLACLGVELVYVARKFQAAKARLDQYHAEHCSRLKKEQYEQRQRILKSRVDECEAAGTDGPGCMMDIMRTQEFLTKFDEEVLKHEGCQN